MNRRRLARLFLCSLIALVPVCTIADGVSESERQWILARLAGDFASSQLRDAVVFKAGDLAAVRLTGISRAVIVLERSVDGDGAWNGQAKITAVGEQHFGDAVLISPSTLLIAAPDTAGAGLGPGATYVFQRNVGGKNHWGLVAKLAPADYPAPGLIEVEQLAESPQVAVTSSPGVVPLAPVADDAPEPPPLPPPTPPPVQAATPEPAPPPPPVQAATPEPAPLPPPTPSPVQTATPEPAPPSVQAATPEPAPLPPPTAPPVQAATPEPALLPPVVPPRENASPEVWDDPAPADGSLRYIAVASMKELPHALAFVATLQECGYPSEIHRNQRGFYVVTLARLPLADAKKQRAQAIAAGDIPREAYLIVGSSFQEKISP